MAQDNILAVIDIGSAETKVFIVDVEPQLKIIGGFSAKTEGMEKGEIVNLGALKESVQSVISVAEQQTGIAGHIRNACLAVSSVALKGFPVTGLTSVKSGVVRKEDKLAARNDAFSACLHRVDEGRHIIQRICRRYLLDRRELEEPLGLRGHELTYDMWVVDADDTYLTELYQIPNRYGMTVKGVFPAALASAESLRSFSEMDKDRLVIDIGAGTTDYVLFRSGAVVCTGVIPVGGGHVTRDISHGLQTTEEHAERLKKNYGYAIARDENVLAEIDLDSVDDVELRGFSRRVSRYKLELVMEYRLRELFELIAKKINAEERVPETVFITGGTSKIAGIAELASKIFQGSDVRLGDSSQDFARNYSDPKYATVVGLAKLYRDELLQDRKASGKVGKLRQFFKEMFK